MISIAMKPFLEGSSQIRAMFEEGKKMAKVYGAENVYDFSIGNPSVASPDVVNETLIKLITNTEPTLLHGYTSAAGDLTVRQKIAEYLNNTYGTNHKAEYIYLNANNTKHKTKIKNSRKNKFFQLTL